MAPGTMVSTPAAASVAQSIPEAETVRVMVATIGLALTLVSAAYVNLAFVGISGKLTVWLGLEAEPSVWISFVLSMLLLALIMRKG